MTKAKPENIRNPVKRRILVGFFTVVLVSGPATATDVAECARPEQGDGATTTITTRLGAVTGKLEYGIQSFLGVRYGKPPVGERRFLAPELHGPWSGTFDATNFGDRAMQPKDSSLGQTYSEDCLTVNIHTPAADGRSRPVLFWIHGGAYYVGSSNDHDGSHLAAQGDVVVVSVNYRLGVFGFLDLSRYDSDLAGSLSNGFRDQILALTWVQDNIADYGGDPDNVTIFGVSAGGASVNALLAAPAADGLYHRALSLSGLGVTNPAPPLASASLLADHLKVDEDDLLAHLKQLSAEDLLTAQLASGIRVDASVDGVVVTRDTYQAIKERGRRGVPYIAGSTREEGKIFTALSPDGAVFDPLVAVNGTTTWLGAKTFGLLRDGADPGEYVTALRDAFPSETERALYERVWAEMFRRSAIRTSLAVTAAGSRGWLYRFDLSAAGGNLGAVHGADVAFTFNDFERPELLRNNWYDPDDPVVRQLAERWSNTVLNFARTGDPNGAGLPHWPEYSADQRAVLILDATPRIEQDPDRELRKRWGDE